MRERHMSDFGEGTGKRDIGQGVAIRESTIAEVVTELGILTEVMPESWKAPWSMMVTESGISIV